ncbi:MAG TPA: ATP-binding protein [bacterium]|nr:ATP-binding protein [bacterium]
MKNASRKVVKKGVSKKPENIRKLQKLFSIVERGKFLWESTFDAIRDPVLLIGRDYRIARANVAAAERSGRPIRSLVGGRCYEVFAGRKAICPHCPLEETLRSGLPKVVEIDGMMEDGDFIVNSYPLKKGRSKPPSSEGPLAVHHYRDVTEEKRLQRKLIQSEKMAAIGMLAGGVAHEINNPLAGILAFAQLLKNELNNPEAQGDLNEIEQAAKRCKKIVEDLLMFARPHGETELKEFSLVDALDQILPLAKLNLKHRNVSMTTEYEAGLPPVKGNSARLQQVFLNLINNAAQSMEKGGDVGVRIFPGAKGSQAVVEVRDQGCGIRKEDMAKIFDPFYTTKGREGTGLGLSICYSIISDHAGKLEVESEPGVGSVFRVILPAGHEAKHGKVHTGH